MNRTRHPIPRKPLDFQCLAASEHHFVGVNKMIPATPSLNPITLNNEACELEARIADNVAELLESA